jgi:hypothetical protein
LEMWLAPQGRAFFRHHTFHVDGYVPTVSRTWVFFLLILSLLILLPSVQKFCTKPSRTIDIFDKDSDRFVRAALAFQFFFSNIRYSEYFLGYLENPPKYVLQGL